MCNQWFTVIHRVLLAGLAIGSASRTTVADDWTGNMAKNPGFEEDFINARAESHVLSFKGDKVVQYVWVDPEETPDWVMVCVRGISRVRKFTPSSMRTIPMHTPPCFLRMAPGWQQQAGTERCGSGMCVPRNWSRSTKMT